MSATRRAIESRLYADRRHTGSLCTGLRAALRPIVPAFVLAVGSMPLVAQEPVVPDPGPQAPAAGLPQGGEQDPAGRTAEASASEAGSPSEAVAPEPSVPDSESARPVANFLRVTRSGLMLRGRPIEALPSYPGDLAVGDIVWADGPAVDGFQPVRIPGGAMGYVHSRFVQLQSDGRLRVADSGIPLRHQPKGGVTPIVTLTRGTELWVLDHAEDGWFLVREPSRQVFLPVDGLQTAPTDATSKRIVDDAKARAEARTQAFLQALADEKALEEARTKRVDEAVELRRRYYAQLELEIAEQDWGSLESDVIDFLQAAATDEPSFAEIDEIQQRIDLAQRIQSEYFEEQKRKQERDHILDDFEEKQAIYRPMRRPLSDYDQGWLRIERPTFGDTVYWLELGGRKIARLTCSTGRYTLEDYEGHHIAVIQTERVATRSNESITYDIRGPRGIYVLGK